MAGRIAAPIKGLKEGNCHDQVSGGRVCSYFSCKIVLGIGPHVKEDQLKNSEVLSLGNAVDDAPFYGKWDIHV